MNLDMELIKNWMINNRLTLHTDKTKYILFSNKSEKLKVLYNNTLIEQVKVVKYLVLLLDSNLKFDLHIDNIKSKLSSIAGMFYRISKFINFKIKRQLYLAFFHSVLSYGICCRGNAKNSK